MADFIHLPDDIGESSDDLGLKPLAKPKHYPVVLSTEGVFVTLDRKTTPPEDIEQTIFGYPIEDKRQIVFADTHSYGIDPNDWAIQYGSVNGGDIKKDLLPNTSSNTSNNDLFPHYKGVWNIGTSMQDEYEGIISYENYENSAIDLIIDTKYEQSTNINVRRYVTCATKQVFDCDVAANLFVSFGLKIEGKSKGNLSRCGIFSSETGWFIEINEDGSKDNFRVARRYTDTRLPVSNRTVDQFFYRSEFVDRLDGSGASGHVINFSYVTMFAIEIGSYDGSAAKFYAYIPDNRVGTHTWTMFHKVSISDTLSEFPERNASALPLTFFHSTTPAINGVTKLSKYGTSVTRVGATTSVIKMFSAAGQFKDLIPFRDSFIFGLLTKDSLNEKRNYTRHFPKYITATANVPTELTIRRYKLDKNNSSTIKLEPSTQEQYDTRNLLYVVDSTSGKISFISTTLEVLVKTVNCNARNILYVPKYDVLYVATNNNSILILNGSDGNIIDSFSTGESDNIDLAFCSVTVNSVLQDRLIVTHSSSFTVWDITDSATNIRGFLSPLFIYEVTNLTIPSTAQVLAADDRFFVALQNNVNIYSATTTTAPSVQTTFSSTDSVLGIAFSQLKLFISLSSGAVSCHTRFSGTNYQNDTQFSFTHNLANPDVIVAVDSVDIVYVASTTNSGIRRKRNYESTVTTIVTNFPTIGIVVDPNLNTLLYNSSQIVTELNSNTIVADLTSANAFLRGNLLAAGINALVNKDGFQPVGDVVSSMIIGNGAKQIDLTHAFQEYREFFVTTYDSFTNELETQDLILFFLKHLGELVSKTIEQISWQANIGTSNFTIVNTATQANPLHIVNIGSGTLSIITGQN